MNKVIFMVVFLMAGCGGEDETLRTTEDSTAVEPVVVPTVGCIELSISCEACTRPTDQLLCNLQVGVNDEDSCNTANDYFYGACVIDPCAELAVSCETCPGGTFLSTCWTVVSTGDPGLCAEQYEYFAPNCL